MPGKILILAATAAICAVVASGCGGSGSGDSSTNSQGGNSGESQVTKAEYIKQGESICTQAQKESDAKIQAAVNKAGREGDSNSLKAQKEIVATGLPPLEKMIKELGALETPSGEESQTSEIIGAFEAAAQELREDPLRAFNPGPKTFEKADEMAAAYGFYSCSKV